MAATRGVVGSVLTLLEEGATHVGVATDHVIESFRNELWPAYKTGDGIDPDLKSQFPIAGGRSGGRRGDACWPMVEFEADDALAAAAAMAAADARWIRCVICTPTRISASASAAAASSSWTGGRATCTTARAYAKFGVPPRSIPDYLALVGDSADGFPGLPGWGAKSAAAVLDRYGRLEDIPAIDLNWKVDVRGARKLAATLRGSGVDEAPPVSGESPRSSATLPVSATVEDLTLDGRAKRRGVSRALRPARDRRLGLSGAGPPPWRATQDRFWAVGGQGGRDVNGRRGRESGRGAIRRW